MNWSWATPTSNAIHLTCIAPVKGCKAVVRMRRGKTRVAASILLTAHLIAASLATERPEWRLDGDLLAGGSSTHPCECTRVHSVPGDPHRQMEGRGK